MKRWQVCLRRIEALPFAAVLICSVVLLGLLAAGAVFLGAAGLSKEIMLHVRLPRVLAAVLAGAGLAGGGVIIQTLLGNPLAGPNIVGLNSGAGLFALVIGILLPRFPQLQPLAAFLGALAAVVLVWLLANRAGTSKMTLLLAGVVLNSVFSAAAEGLCVFFSEAQGLYAGFRVGGLSAVRVSVLKPAGIGIAASVCMVLLRTDILELLSLGDETAHSLGVCVKRSRLFFLACAACMIGAAVSFSGLIGFLGLIVPHGVRLITGEELRKLFPLSVLWGGIVLLVCDTIARTVFAPFELSVGIVLSILGAPIFIRMLLNRKAR